MTRTIFTSHSFKLPLSGLKPGMDGIAEMIWQELIAFQDWHKWMPGTGEVTRVDTGNLGRGSVVQFKSRTSLSSWSISCWDPPRRLELITERQGKELAYGFSLIAGHKNTDLVIHLDVECSPHGFWSLLEPLLRWQQRRYGQKLLNNFVESLQNE